MTSHNAPTSNHPLFYVKVDLDMGISAICTHLRNKAFTSEENEGGALRIMIESQLMTDEVGHLMRHHEAVEKALTQYQTGEPFAEYADGEIPESIYQYCLRYFDEVECPLGSATELLSKWVGSYSERHKALSQAYEQLYGDQIMLHIPNETVENQFQLATDSEKFYVKSRQYLRLIEQEQILSEYNERMARVRRLLLDESPIPAILALL